MEKFYRILVQLDDQTKFINSLNTRLSSGPFDNIEHRDELEKQRDKLIEERLNKLVTMIIQKPNLLSIEQDSLMLYYGVIQESINCSKDVVDDLINERYRVLRRYFDVENID